MISLPSFDEWLLIGRAVFLIFSFTLAAASFRAWRRAALEERAQAHAATEELRNRLDSVDARLVASRHAIQQLAEALERSLRAEPARRSGSPGYPIAVRLARGGARAQEIVESCGLSQGEAELVCRLHGSAAATG
jgi:Protein of unknown function (DUF2802)